ncbi:ACP S-malonyltransferase [soil metagenome]
MQSVPGIMALAFLFPGQGSQAVGMGRALADAFPAARAVFTEVDAALDQNLSQIMWSGPESDLTQTENAQPALMAISMAVLRVLESEFDIVLSNVASCVAGHSLGEYSALAAAGTFTLADTARLLKRRGKAMQSATPQGVGAMAALLGLDYEEVEGIAAEASQDEVCSAANDNSPGQVVVSGHKAAVDRAVEIAKERGAKRAVLLAVSAPFHCALMQPAAQIMAEVLSSTPMREPTVPLYANVTASPLQRVDDIRAGLVAQVTGTVRWRESMAAMASSGVQLFCEVGAGKVLSGLVKRNAPGASALSIGTLEDIEASAATLKRSGHV